MTPAEQQRQAKDDASAAVRFMAMKAAIFILVPFVAAAIAAYLTLK